MTSPQITPPRILVIDDQLANEPTRHGNFCFEKSLAPIEVTTSDSKLAQLCAEEDAMAGAVFESGQVRRGEAVENSIDQILKTVESGWPHKTGWRWALILIDLHFDSSPPRHEDGEFGFKILQELVRVWPFRESRPGNSELPIIMLTSLSRSQRERLANVAGAHAYVEKPDLSKTRLTELLSEHGLIQDQDGNLIGRSQALLNVLRDARRIAQMDSGNAMILGPQGAGKSSLALYIHNHSRLSKAPFVRFFSSPGASQLEYANLFGWWKGAHNQAEESSAGAAEKAHKGTLLIDEVHNLASDNQQELLQFGRLDKNGSRWLRRLGNFPTSPEKTITQANKSVLGELDSNKSLIAVDVLLLSATNEPLNDPNWRSTNGFSEPLYTRLAVEYAGKPLQFPSLLERREDIPELFESFLNRETERIRGRSDDGKKLVDEEVKSRLSEHDWPGNVAELEGVARVVARNSKDFTEVIFRHLPILNESISDTPSTVPSPQPASTARRAISLKDIPDILKTVEVPRSLGGLDLQLASIQEAYGQLVRNILEVTLEQTKIARGGKNYVTPALRNLFPNEITAAYQAYRKLQSLSKLFEKNPPAPESLLASAIAKAKEYGPKSKKNGDTKGPNDTDADT